MPLRIYLADLTHTGLGIATEAFPLNIGLIASYALRQFGKAIEISLFKYPEELKEALVTQPPHLLGCSNYTWNANLSSHFLKLAKSIDPTILTVFGGTNYPFDPENQRKFLLQHPEVDLHIYYEGEKTFCNIVERLLSIQNRSNWLAEEVPGCQFLDKKTGQLRSGPPVDRIKDLNTISSPYLTGLLDKFFDRKLTPLLETARGCPFTCNFCNAGNFYFNKVNLFSDAYLQEEWEYVAHRAAQAGIGHMTLADNNFGMIPRDVKTAELMHRLREKTGWPRSVTAWTGKNSKKRVIDVTRLLGDTLVISMAVQSMDERVLKNIARQNIKLEDYQAIAQELNAQGRPQMGELIAPLPTDSWDSYRKGLYELLDSHVSTVIVHTLQMLHGTPYKDDPAYIAQHGFVRKYRLVPLDFGLYDGTPVFDTEEVAVATRTFSLSDYVESRKLLYLVDLCYNGSICAALKKYLRSHEIKMSEWIECLYRASGQLPPHASTIFKSFLSETRGELWDSEQELVRFYSEPKNYQKLVSGESGGNLLFKHKVWMFSEAAQDWLGVVFSVSEQLLFKQADPKRKGQIPRELSALKLFTLRTVQDAFCLTTSNGTLSQDFEYDVPAWLDGEPSEPLERYRSPSPIRLHFFFDQEQRSMRQEAKNRYGDHLSGAVKWIQRLAGIQRVMRKVAYTKDPHVPSNDRFDRVLG